MKAIVSTRITISAHTADVFGYLINLKRHYLWNPHIRKISSHERLALGSTYKTESQILGVTVKATNIVTKFVPSRELILENKLGIVAYKAHFRLETKAKKTVVTLTTTLATDSNFWAFSVPVLKQLALRELRTDLEALKIAVENNLE